MTPSRFRINLGLLSGERPMYFFWNRFPESMKEKVKVREILTEKGLETLTVTLNVMRNENLKRKQMKK